MFASALLLASSARAMAPALGGQVFACTTTPDTNSTVHAPARGACAVGSVGLIDPATGKWNTSSCIAVDWADDAECASVMADGTVLVYVTPSGGEDTFIANVDFDSGKVKKAIVGGDQGNLRCTPQGKCYGILPESGKRDPTALIEVDGRTGDSKAVLTLEAYGGYTVDASVVDPDNGRYHAILVGDPHSNGDGDSASGGKSNQYLVTIDLTSMKIVAEAPVGSNLMGPFAFSRALGLMTFGSDRFDGLATLDYRSGKQTRAAPGTFFGTVYLFTAAFSADAVFAYNIWPQPAHFASVATSASPARVTANHTFPSPVHALAAAWK